MPRQRRRGAVAVARSTSTTSMWMRANNVRSNSVNSVNSVNSNRNVNVNTNRNVNVNVEGGRCCHNGWDNDYHPVATAAAVTATVAVTSAVIGSMVRTRAARLRAGQLRRHGVPAVRHHLVSASGHAIRGGESTLLTGSGT